MISTVHIDTVRYYHDRFQLLQPIGFVIVTCDFYDQWEFSSAKIER